MQMPGATRTDNIWSESAILFAQTFHQAEHRQTEKVWTTFSATLQYRKIDKAETEVLANRLEGKSGHLRIIYKKVVLQQSKETFKENRSKGCCDINRFCYKSTTQEALKPNIEKDYLLLSDDIGGLHSEGWFELADGCKAKSFTAD